jgi:hypothetical protein
MEPFQVEKLAHLMKPWERLFELPEDQIAQLLPHNYLWSLSIYHQLAVNRDIALNEEGSIDAIKSDMRDLCFDFSQSYPRLFLEGFTRTEFNVSQKLTGLYSIGLLEFQKLLLGRYSLHFDAINPVEALNNLYNVIWSIEIGINQRPEDFLKISDYLKPDRSTVIKNSKIIDKIKRQVRTKLGLQETDSFELRILPERVIYNTLVCKVYMKVTS